MWYRIVLNFSSCEQFWPIFNNKCSDLWAVLIEDKAARVKSEAIIVTFHRSILNFAPLITQHKQLKTRKLPKKKNEKRVAFRSTKLWGLLAIQISSSTSSFSSSEHLMAKVISRKGKQEKDMLRTLPQNERRIEAELNKSVRLSILWVWAWFKGGDTHIRLCLFVSRSVLDKWLKRRNKATNSSSLFSLEVANF